MCNCTDEVWIEQPDVYEQLISREAPASITLNSTVVLSVRHTTWSANERATLNGVGERACGTQQRAVGNNGRAWRFNGGTLPERTT